MRTFTNKPGEYFDPAKTDVVYAEDMNELAQQTEAKQQYPAWSAQFQGDINHIDKRKYIRTLIPSLTTAPKKMIVLNGVIFGITDDAPGRFFRFDPNGVLGVSSGSASGLTAAFSDIVTDGEFVYLSAIETTVTIVKIDPVSLLAVATYTAGSGESGIACMIPIKDFLICFTPDSPMLVIKLASYNLSLASATHPATYENPKFVVRDDSFFYLFFYDGGVPKLGKFDLATLTEQLIYTLTTLSGVPVGMCIDGSFLYCVDDDNLHAVEKINIDDLTYNDSHVLGGSFKKSSGVTFDGFNLVVSGFNDATTAVLMDPDTLSELGVFFDTMNYTTPVSVCTDGLRHYLGIFDSDAYVISKILRKGNDHQV